MAPKKNVKISSPEKVAVADLENPPKGRPKRAQPKVTSRFTISIPINKTGLDVPDAAKKVDTNTKRALANEVARAQILKEPIAARVMPPTPKRTRGRKKEVVSEFFNTSDIKQEPAEEILPPPDLVPTTATTPTIVKKNNRKTPVKNAQATKVTRKRVADSTVKKPRIKRQKITTKPVTTNQELTKETEETIQDDITKADSTEQTTPKVPKTSASIENPSDVNSKVLNTPVVSPQKKRILRGKKTVTSAGKEKQATIEATNTEASGSIAPVPDGNTLLGVDPPDAISAIKSNAKGIRSSKRIRPSIKPSTKEANTVKVDSRKNSISSASNLSWTRDISSSSTTTCFTVVSNDFFCFDKKLPVLKLVNIDNEVINYKPNRLNSTSDSSSSSSSDSESSSEESAHIGSSSSVKVNSLNLSSSSCVATPIEDQNINKKDYNKAAENLMQALNKIDLEFINWIHDADTITTDLDRIKDSLFDILSNEFYAITHCRNLQDILNNDVSDSNNITNEPKLTTEKEVESNTVERKTKRAYNFKSRSESEKMRTRSDKTDVNTVVKSNLVSKKVVNDTEKSNTAESNAIIIKTVENYKNNTAEVDPLRSNVASDSNKNKIVDSYPLYSDNVKDNPIISKNDDSNLVKSHKFDNISLEKSNIINNNLDNSENVNDKTANNRQENSTNYVNRVENNTGSSNWVEISSNVNNKLENNHTKSRVEMRTEHELLKPSTSGNGSNIFNNSLTQRRSRVSESSGSSSNQDVYADHDDDDALSLFAESITGIESSRINTSNISAPVEKQLEEYIPEPIKKDFISPQNYSYCPTKIGDQMKNGVIKTICEKQNADSTSIYKECNSLPPEETGSLPDSVEDNHEIIEKPGLSHTEINIPNNLQKITLMADVYMLRPKESNIIFKGYCYFNLIHKCTSTMYSKPCRYSHDVPDDHFIINKLSTLTNDILIKEYMLIRRNDHVLRRYGILVLCECVRRGLTRISVEIAYDFIMRHSRGILIDGTIKTAVFEIVLLHLNNVDLSVCEDLLFLAVPGGSLLCEVFMQVMTSTQNFTRFKLVFLSLTYFMVNNDRTFSIEVAEQILERVCILPFDEPVIRAVLQIIRLTKPEIFLNSIIDNFEKLISVNSDVLDQYSLIKSEINFEKLARKVADKRPVGQALEQPMLVQPTEPLLGWPLFAQTTEPAMNVRPEMREGVPLPPSPDTTHLDNMNKTAEEAPPNITRIIRGFSFAPNTQTPVSPSSSNNEDIISTPNHNNWRHRSILQHINRPSYPRGMMRPPRMRPPGRMMRTIYPNNHRLVRFGGSPTVYPSPGPDI